MTAGPSAAVGDLADLDVDPTTPGFYLRPDYDDVLRRLRGDAPVFEFAPATRAVSRYHDIREISRDPQRFCSSRGVLVNDPIRDGQPLEGSILHLDPPEHAEYRRLLSRSFTPRAVERFEPRIRDLVGGLLDRPSPTETIDFVAELSAPLPALVIAELLGLGDCIPDDFLAWSDATIEATDGIENMSPESAVAAGQLWAFLAEQVQRRQADPDDDLVSLLVTADLGGRRLTDTEIVTFCLSLLVAGNETTRHLLSGAVAALAEHVDQRARLVDAGALGVAVEECLRWVTPIQAFARTATRDTDVGGEPVAEGDYLVLLYASGNRDEAAFGPTAGIFDAARQAPVPNLAFGFGEHLCLGAALARLEGRVFLDELLQRFPHFAVAGEPTWLSSSLVRGHRTLPVVLQP